MLGGLDYSLSEPDLYPGIHAATERRLPPCRCIAVTVASHRPMFHRPFAGAGAVTVLQAARCSGFIALETNVKPAEPERV